MSFQNQKQNNNKKLAFSKHDLCNTNPEWMKTTRGKKEKKKKTRKKNKQNKKKKKRKKKERRKPRKNKQTNNNKNIVFSNRI